MRWWRWLALPCIPPAPARPWPAGAIVTTVIAPDVAVRIAHCAHLPFTSTILQVASGASRGLRAAIALARRRKHDQKHQSEGGHAGDTRSASGPKLLQASSDHRGVSVCTVHTHVFKSASFTGNQAQSHPTTRCPHVSAINAVLAVVQHPHVSLRSSLEDSNTHSRASQSGAA